MHHPKQLLLLTLLADLGHVTPLAQAALSFKKHGGTVYAIGPHESAALFERYDLPYETLPEEAYRTDKAPLRELSNASAFRQSLYLDRKTADFYNIPKQLNGLRHIDHAVRRVSEIQPDVLIADQHRFKDAYLHISRVTGIPIIMFESYGTHFRAQSPGFGHRTPQLLERIRVLGSTILGRSIGIIWDRSFNRQNKKTRTLRKREIEVIQTQLSLHSTPAASPALTISAGVCTLEEKYLADRILFNEHARTMGPFEPHVCWEGAEELRDWIREDPARPTLYVAFGTMVAAASSEIEAIVDCALESGARAIVAMPDSASLRQRWPEDRVFHTEWAPQAAVLAEPNVSVFATHAGCMSMQEALWFGKAVLCIPKKWDQFYNAWVAEKLGVGIYLDCPGRPRWSLKESIHRLLTDQSFRQRSQELSQEIQASRADTIFPEIVEETIQRQERNGARAHELYTARDSDRSDTGSSGNMVG